MNRDDLMAEMAEDAKRPVKEVDESDPTMSRLVELGNEMQSLKDKIDDLRAQEKEVRERYDKLRLDVIPDLMTKVGIVDDTGKGRFTNSEGALISLRTDLHAGYRKADEPRVFAWLRERGMGDVIKETVHHGTFRALAREMLADGAPFPEFVTTYYETSATLRRK